MPDKTNDFKTKLPLVHRAIADWYKERGRHSLPWRNTRDPYAIYLSEIMLQQTQVKTVLERYYGPFLKRFPTLASLAKANRQDVMKQWEGLGYYTRAGNLHDAAQACSPALPDTVEGLIALPGIGRNTAHAIACFAYGQPVAVMEANVRRVLCRVFAIKKLDDKLLWQKAMELLDTKHPFNYNQAMMDIGSMVCTRRNPKCGECPLSAICKGKKDPEAYPEAKIAKTTPVRERTIVAVMDEQGHLYLSRRETRFLKGLYGFPEYPKDTKNIVLMSKTYKVTDGRKLGVIEQVYSHFTLRADVYLLRIGKIASSPDFDRVSLKKVKELPLSRADHKIIELIVGHIE